VISVLGRLRQEDLKFHTSLSYRVSASPAWAPEQILSQREKEGDEPSSLGISFTETTQAMHWPLCPVLEYSLSVGLR